MKLSERLEKYKLVLKQLDICQAELHEIGYLTQRDHEKIEDFVTEERFRVDRTLKSMGIPPSQVPTGIPSLDAAKKVGAAANGH